MVDQPTSVRGLAVVQHGSAHPQLTIEHRADRPFGIDRRCRRFGPTAADLASVQQMGVPAFIDAMLVLPAGSPVEPAATTAR